MFGGERNIRVLTPEPLLVLPQYPKSHQSNKNVFWLLKSVLSSTEIGLSRNCSLHVWIISACMFGGGMFGGGGFNKGACLNLGRLGMYLPCLEFIHCAVLLFLPFKPDSPVGFGTIEAIL
jgi:hypothetical protein